MIGINKILVTGDFIIDNHIISGNLSTHPFPDKKSISIVREKGGAYLTYDLITRAIPEKELVYFGLNTSELEKAVMHYPEHQSYLEWDIIKKKVKGEDVRMSVFRDYLGVGERFFDSARIKYDRIKDAEKNCDIVVIDEANLGFRDNNELWDFPGDPVVVYKTSYPVCTGKLFQTLVSKAGDNLFTIVTLENLRRYDVKVSRNISWEQTALDIVYEVTHNAQLLPLLKSPNLIITIGAAGAVYITNGGNSEKAEFSLLFDPENMEDEWEEKEKSNKESGYNGSTVGLGASFTAGFVSGYYWNSQKVLSHKSKTTPFSPEWSDFIIAGLNFLRNTLTKGLIAEFRPDGSTEYNLLTKSDIEGTSLHRFIKAYIPSPYWNYKSSYLKNSQWTILENNYDETKPGYKKVEGRNFFSLARSLAYDFTDAIKYAPVLKVGNLVTFDRKEIEGFRNIRKQIKQYHKFYNGARPLNIAVFGAPGSGKSFAVKEVAKSVFESNKDLLSFQVYNLSQFKDPGELAGAFHKIRDAVLEGKLPFIFWDEFDSDRLKWLQFMLAPMQDGRFQDGKDTHPLGKAIFIFAGGTCQNMLQFKSSERDQDFIEKKGPDFLSRINCYIDIFGPNPRKLFNPETRKIEQNDETDICYPVRRALFLRSNLGLDKKETLKIDWGLLSAFLEVDQFNNGSRSLERLLSPLKNNKSGTIIRSDLPSDEIMEMNVNFTSFIELMYDQDRDREKLSENIAKCIHEVWMKKNVRESVYNVKYEELPFDARLDNIAAAKRMIDVIDSTKEFTLVRNSNGLRDDGADFNNKLKKDTAFMERIAEEEHNGWCKARMDSGWDKGIRSNYYKTHPCLVPYNDMDKGIKDKDKQYQKNKDRDTVRQYSEFLKGTDYCIVKVGQ
jgi:hypothetical protein